MNLAITPVEATLRRAKETLSYLNDVVSQIERGGVLNYDSVQKTINTCSTEVQNLLDPYSSQSGGLVHNNNNDNGINISTLHARSNNTNNITELQRRRGQQVLSELAIIDSALQRLRRKAEEKQNYATNLRNLLGSDAKNSENARNKFSDLEELARERESLQYTRRRVQQMQLESSEVLQALQDQGRRLGGAGEKMANMLETIGVSNATILEIIRRNQMDAWMVYCGIAFLLFLLWYLW